MPPSASTRKSRSIERTDSRAEAQKKRTKTKRGKKLMMMSNWPESPPPPDLEEIRRNQEKAAIACMGPDWPVGKKPVFECCSCHAEFEDLDLGAFIKRPREPFLCGRCLTRRDLDSRAGIRRDPIHSAEGVKQYECTQCKQKYELEQDLEFYLPWDRAMRYCEPCIWERSIWMEARATKLACPW